MEEEKSLKEKNNTSKVVIIFLVLIFIFTLGYVAYNNFLKNSNSSSDNDNEEVDASTDNKKDEIISFAIKNRNSIVAFTSSGSENIIYDFSNSIKYNDEIISLKENRGEFHYYYDESSNIIYVFLLSDNGEKYLISVDLNIDDDNYIPEIITKLDNEISGNHAYYIVKIDNSIYFSYNNLYKYDINSKKVEKTDITSNKRIMWLLKYDNKLIYNNNQDIYVLNISNNESTKIASGSVPAYVYKNFLIYQNDSEFVYYSYDLTNNSVKKISNTYGVQSIGTDYAIPFNDGIYSFEHLNLYRYDNQIEKVYTFTCNDFTNIISECTDAKLNSINEIIKISDNKMSIIFGNSYDGDFYSVIFDLDTKKVINDGSHDIYQYTEQFYIK